MTQISLKSAILSFAFSGVLTPQRRDADVPRIPTEGAPKKK